MADLDIAAIVARADLPAIASHATEVRKQGSEFKARCVFHSPDDSPSLTFFHKGGKWQFKCFACGEFGDALDWICELEGLEVKPALERLGAEWPAKFNGKASAAARKPDWITSKPPPNAGLPHMNHREYGEPSRTWEYRDAAGETLGFIARYDPPSGKQIRCWSWGARGNERPHWGCGHWTAPRPLYGLDKLAANPTAPVLLVEGEKAADAAQALLPAYVVMTWPQGVNGRKHADLTPLRGHRVDLWPDNDQPGIECMEAARSILGDPEGLACHGKIVDPKGMDEGFDAADWTGTADELMAWLRERVTEYPKIAPPAAPEPAPEPEQPAADMGPDFAPPTEDGPPGDEDDDDPMPASMSEDMLADRFAARHGKTWRYVKPWGTWLEWRKDGWYRDDTNKIDRLAVQITREAIYWPEAQKMSDDAKRRVNSKRTAGAVRDLALSDRRLVATADQWDTNKMLLGVPGGVVDLTTGEYRDARPDDYITKRTAVPPAEGDAPIWRKFLETVTNEDGELISFLQRYAGYSLTGETREQCLAFLYGTGQNGKGVFITTLSRIMGDYAVSADADVFMESDHNRHTTEIARLRSARLVCVDETDGSKRWNEKRIKRITGGGKIEAHFMRQDDFEFDPHFKLVIAGNHKPQLRGVGKAIQRRIHLVPFTVTIPDSERDDRLVEKLEAEYPQILSWIIQGCIDWQAAKLSAPTKVTDATSQYVESQDVIGEWLEERTEQSGEVARPIAYKNYRAWIEARGEHSMGTKGFWTALEDKGYTMRKSNGIRYIERLSLRQAMPSHEPDGDGIDF